MVVIRPTEAVQCVMNLHRGLAIIHQLIRGLADSNCTASSLTNNSNRHCDQQYRRQLLLILELRPFISVSVCLSLSVPFSFFCIYLSMCFFTLSSTQLRCTFLSIVCAPVYAMQLSMITSRVTFSLVRLTLITIITDAVARKFLPASLFANVRQFRCCIRYH